MSEENSFFSRAGKVHPRFKTPGNALILNAVWTIILILSGSFDMLTDMLIFVSWFFYAMSSLGVFILRFKYKETERPYRVWGYPVVPMLFILFAGFFLAGTLINDITAYREGSKPVINSVLGMLIALAGLPLYYFSTAKKVQR
jgi:APA family basic amino acid/polyamine antiporter